MAKGKETPSHEEGELGSEWKPRDDETLGGYIRRIRLMRGMNLPDVARVTATLPDKQRVSHPYLSQIELGQVFRPAPERLRSIAQVLGIPEGWLLEKAGFSPTGIAKAPRSERSPVVEQIALRSAALDASDQQFILQMIETMTRMRRGRGRSGKP